MTIMTKNYDVLIPMARKYPDWESEKAEIMFKRFISEGFSYDDISNHPDYPAFASAELLHDILPQMIDEMLERKDTVNFLIYPMISAINPSKDPKFPAYEERAQKLISLADKHFAEKACKFLEALADEPPIPEDEFDRVRNFWKNKLEELT